MSRRKQRSAFDQVSEFDRGRIGAYRDCGLSFRQIGSRVGRSQTTVMWICDRGEFRRAFSPTDVVDHIHLSSPVCVMTVSVRTIRRSLQQSGLSARRPLLGLPLTQNNRCLHRQWCDEKRMWAAELNEVVLTDESRMSATLRWSDSSLETPWRERILNSCSMHRHTGPAPDIIAWASVGYHSCTPLVRIAGTVNIQRYISEVLGPVVLPYLQGLTTAIFQQDNA
ncbi:transposable element Tcb1 transposase [Trichonephila clavipes]|nr:transposable element Tcb1 transposase [Trichonephila clavipes]